MYHQRRNWAWRLLFSTFASLSLVCATTWQPQAAFAQGDKASSGLTGRLVETRALTFPLVPAQQRLKDKPERAKIYQLDLKPLGDRRPLLMVHGLRGESRKLFRWDHVLKRLQSSSEFNDRFKIYFLRYDSTASLRTSIPQFKEELLRLRDSSGGKPVSILALSLGGNLVEQAILDPQINSAIQVVFTLGTPFHGSPLFCADWYQYSLYKNLSFPWTRVDHSLAYRFYFHCNPNLLEELEWDNADGYIPDAGRFRSLLPLGPKGNLTVANAQNDRLLKLNRESTPDKSKFITYAGYLLNPYLLPSLKRQIETTVMAPYTYLTVKVPAHLAREHPVLKMLNHEISRTIPREGQDPKPDNWPHIYGLNDGIAPVNSAIFLPSEALKANPVDNEDDVPRLRAAADVKLARVFRNIDHLTFVDGYRPASSSPLLRDELNPQDGYRQMFDWILSDLLHSEPLPDHLAREAQRTPDHCEQKTVD
jgi:hypothetical protein